MGVTTNAQSRIEFVGQTGETNRGGRLLATVSVLRKHASPTSRGLIAKRRSGWRCPAGGAPWAPSAASTRNPKAEANTAELSDRTAIQSPTDVRLMNAGALPLSTQGPRGQRGRRVLCCPGPAQCFFGRVRRRADRG